ncbi:glycosyltransferase family 61 protein [Demequina sp.]|uniref:glycosyltransferase family 61 protein n=1 Tax=Demequina sp. TaxID=2050685 RepID=UPI0025FB47B0|nr:glycosyltransferase family 61 protein [Demequina sp.]
MSEDSRGSEATAMLPRPQGSGRLRTVAAREGEPYTATALARPAPVTELRGVDGSSIAVETPLSSTLPEEGFAVLADARIVGPSAWPLTAGNAVPIDAVFVHELRVHRAYGNAAAAAPEVRLDGETVNLASAFTMRNYAHAVLDGLGRGGILVAGGYDLAVADHVVVPRFRSPTISALLARAGVSPDRIVPAPARGALWCERLVQATFPGRARQYSEAPARFMRSLGIAGGPGRRLMILRTGEKRAVANTAQMHAVAAEFDLEIYDPRASEFSPADFAGAELVVAAHGAALGDLGFCPPGAGVVELLPSGHRYPYFATLAASSGLAYVPVLGRSVSDAPQADVTVDPDELRAAINSLPTPSPPAGAAHDMPRRSLFGRAPSRRRRPPPTR